MPRPGVGEAKIVLCRGIHTYNAGYKHVNHWPAATDLPIVILMMLTITPILELISAIMLLLHQPLPLF